MRIGLVVAVCCGCSNPQPIYGIASDAARPDAIKCRAAGTRSDCVSGGLSTLNLQGSWTFNGMVSGGASPQPLTSAVTMSRSNPTACGVVMTFASFPSPGGTFEPDSASSTLLSYAYASEQAPDFPNETWFVCVATASGSLEFHRVYSYYMGGTFQVFQYVDGVLTPS